MCENNDYRCKLYAIIWLLPMAIHGEGTLVAEKKTDLYKAKMFEDDDDP